MIKFQIFLFVLLMQSTVFARIYQAHEYNFPFSNPYEATLMSALDRATVAPRWIELVPRKDRAAVPVFEKRNTVRFAVFAQKTNAPLIFVIPGVGGAASSGTALMLAEKIYRAGNHAVVLPNPFSWSYALAVSETALPGLMSRDIPEYFQFLTTINAHLQTNLKLQIQNYALVGYSWGALLVSHLHNYDQQVGNRFNFRKVVLISPALDIQYGISRIDGLFEGGANIPKTHKEDIMSRLTGLAKPYMEKSATLADVKRIFKTMNLKPEELNWVIGDSFRQSIADMIFVSQQVKDLGILKARVDRTHRNDRMDECYKYSFADYLNQFVYPNLTSQEQASRNSVEILQSQGLVTFQDSLKHDTRIYVMQNRDDFIAEESSLQWLINTVPESRLYLYPLGGHVGNMWFPQNQSDLLDILK